MQYKVGVDSKYRKRILQKVFGNEGLPSATNVEEFDDMAAALLMELPPNMSAQFAPYLTTQILPLMRENLQRGSISWTKNNNVESLNHVLKQMVNWRPQMLSDLIDKIKTVAHAQLKDSDRALFGRGDFTCD